MMIRLILLSGQEWRFVGSEGGVDSGLYRCIPIYMCIPRVIVYVYRYIYSTRIIIRLKNRHHTSNKRTAESNGFKCTLTCMVDCLSLCGRRSVQHAD